jgi:hypothetical protein
MDGWVTPFFDVGNLLGDCGQLVGHLIHLALDVGKLNDAIGDGRIDLCLDLVHLPSQLFHLAQASFVEGDVRIDGRDFGVVRDEVFDLVANIGDSGDGFFDLATVDIDFLVHCVDLLLDDNNLDEEEEEDEGDESDELFHRQAIRSGDEEAHKGGPGADGDFSDVGFRAVDNRQSQQSNKITTSAAPPKTSELNPRVKVFIMPSVTTAMTPPSSLENAIQPQPPSEKSSVDNYVHDSGMSLKRHMWVPGANSSGKQRRLEKPTITIDDASSENAVVEPEPTAKTLEVANSGSSSLILTAVESISFAPQIQQIPPRSSHSLLRLTAVPSTPSSWPMKIFQAGFDIVTRLGQLKL